MRYLLKPLAVLSALAVGALALPGRAQAHDGWHGGGWGWGVGIDVAPIVVPGPYVYPPYYAPPPVYVAPAPANGSKAGAQRRLASRGGACREAGGRATAEIPRSSSSGRTLCQSW